MSLSIGMLSSLPGPEQRSILSRLEPSGSCGISGALSWDRFWLSPQADDTSRLIRVCLSSYSFPFTSSTSPAVYQLLFEVRTDAGTAAYHNQGTFGWHFMLVQLNLGIMIHFLHWVTTVVHHCIYLFHICYKRPFQILWAPVAVT